MRKMLFLAIVVAALAACSLPTDSSGGPVVVVNSAWEPVSVPGAKALSGAKALDEDTAAAYVEAYNAANTEDQLFIYPEGELPPVEEAPLVDAFICRPTDHGIIHAYLDWPRVDLVERRETWRAQTYADAGVLYVDHIPEVVPPPPEAPAFERFACYLIAPDASIAGEDHCAGWEAAGYASQEAYFADRSAMFRAEAYSRGEGWYAHCGSLYTVPVVETPETPVEE